MKAIVQDKYGPPDVLELREIETPAIGDREVLVRVVAAGLHAGDCFTVRGSPFPVRLATGLTRPRPGVPGYDLAGRVEAIGGRVTRFSRGDEVFGVSRGTRAEYARAEESTIRTSHRPACAEGPHRIQAGRSGHRQDVSAQRHPCCARIPRTGARARQGRHHHLIEHGWLHRAGCVARERQSAARRSQSM